MVSKVTAQDSIVQGTPEQSHPLAAARAYDY
jgi:hypothetical protein